MAATMETPRRRTASVAFCKTVSPSAKRSRVVRKKHQRQRASPLSLRAKRLLLNQLCPSHQETSEANIVPMLSIACSMVWSEAELVRSRRAEFRIYTYVRTYVRTQRYTRLNYAERAKRFTQIWKLLILDTYPPCLNFAICGVTCSLAASRLDMLLVW